MSVTGTLLLVLSASWLALAIAGGEPLISNVRMCRFSTTVADPLLVYDLDYAALHNVTYYSNGTVSTTALRGPPNHIDYVEGHRHPAAISAAYCPIGDLELPRMPSLDTPTWNWDVSCYLYATATQGGGRADGFGVVIWALRNGGRPMFRLAGLGREITHDFARDNEILCT